ncbi:uncharacterized protein LOC128852278 isoform X2 [Cuculus canorus]|uniref:uncharacterized protein LOC128852278 isoform X2 n=1 Tax=Cuculus canorus TaxID=55661 RepID=UPI0023AA7B97|nr:uncharacterized protein LOC128852278 isoform X2 [Cuculus canorus]
MKGIPDAPVVPRQWFESLGGQGITAPVTRRHHHHPNGDIPQPPLARGRQKLLWGSPTAASAFPFVHPSLQDVGLGTAGRAHTSMNLYTTNYAVANGQQHLHPHISHPTESGFVTNNLSAVFNLLCPPSRAEGYCLHTAVSTTTEHFQPLCFPEDRSLLAQCNYQPQKSCYSHLHTGVEGPQDMGQCSKNNCTGPTCPDVLQKMTIGAKEPPGFSVATWRSDGILPPCRAEDMHVPAIPSICQGGEKILVLPTISKRGSAFIWEVPGCQGMEIRRTSSHCLGAEGLPKVGHPIPLMSQGLQVPRVIRASLPGQYRAVRKEPLGFTTKNGQYPALPLAVPAWCWWGPTWMGRPMASIQPPHPSGFTTNNDPTKI